MYNIIGLSQNDENYSLCIVSIGQEFIIIIIVNTSEGVKFMSKYEAIERDT